MMNASLHHAPRYGKATMVLFSLAKLDPGQHSPRSKHYDIKVHWFRSHFKPNQITVEKIDTRIQKDDISTKPLPPETFIHLRKFLMGW
jgi:hypothetical protein